MIDFKKLAALGIVASSALILSACNPYKTSSTGGTSQAGNSQQASPAAVEGNVITYSDSGFSPTELKVKVGESITFTNSSMATVQVNSAVHPTHTLYPELNIGSIAAGESKSVTFTTTGTKKYHNHLNASQIGTIVVE